MEIKLVWSKPTEFYCKACERSYKEPSEVILFDGVPEYFCTCGSGKIYPKQIKAKPIRQATPKVGKYIDIQKELVKKYRIKLDVRSECYGRTHAHIKERRICKWDYRSSVENTFTLLHEIGHIETTTSKMRRCESEYYATQWAIDRAKEYGLVIPEKQRKLYQNYIDREKARGIRRGGAGYDTNLELKW